MGRKSALTEKQWEDIGTRLLAGESARALAREYKITEGPIRARFKTQHEEIKIVANQIVKAESALKSLPIKTQIKTLDYAEKLRSISDNMLGGASHSASNFNRLAMFANEQTEKLDPSKTLDDNAEALKSIAALTRMANDAAVVPMALLNSNKEAAKSGESVPSGLDHFYGE